MHILLLQDIEFFHCNLHQLINNAFQVNFIHISFMPIWHTNYQKKKKTQLRKYILIIVDLSVFFQFCFSYFVKFCCQVHSNLGFFLENCPFYCYFTFFLISNDQLHLNFCWEIIQLLKISVYNCYQGIFFSFPLLLCDSSHSTCPTSRLCCF